MCRSFLWEMPPESVTLNDVRCILANVRRCGCQMEGTGLVGKLRPISGLAV